MKRILAIAFAAVLIAQAFLAFAQDQEGAEPSERSVLQAARDKYWSRQKPEVKAEPAMESEKPAAQAAKKSEADENAAQEGDFPYTTVHLSFVPGLSLPGGIYDSSLSAGMIGDISRDVSGAQGSGVFNIARNIRGAQGAGVFNIADGEVRGAQGAGVFNLADEDVRGAQGAGVFNIAGDLSGAQGAGVFNIARDVEGIQAAGVFNVARRVDGVQVGLVNLAKSMDGVQIGLFNYVVDGIHSLGFAYEPQSSYAYSYWQSGSSALYTRWGVGAPSREWELDFDDAVASFGLGSRHSVSIVDIDLDLSAEWAIGSLSFERADRGCRQEDCGDRGEGDRFRLRSWPRAYPSIRAEASLPLGHHWRIFGGLKADIDIEDLGDRMPEALKKGDSWRGRLWGGDFTVWPKWFFGLKI